MSDTKMSDTKMSATRGPQGEAKAPAQQSFLEEAHALIDAHHQDLDAKFEELYEPWVETCHQAILRSAQNRILYGATNTVFDFKYAGVAIDAKMCGSKELMKALAPKFIERALGDDRFKGIRFESKWEHDDEEYYHVTMYFEKL